MRRANVDLKFCFPLASLLLSLGAELAMEPDTRRGLPAAIVHHSQRDHAMKRLHVLALGAALFLPLGLIGCADETKIENKETVKTPEGSVTTTDTKTIEKTGEAKP